MNENTQVRRWSVRHTFCTGTIRAVVHYGTAVMLLYCGCTAYFNTYYNAETAFKEGQKLHKKILRNYPDSLVVTPSTEIAAKYDRTIDKTIKIFEVFPKGKKWHDDALLLMGKAHFYKIENEKAIRRFRQLEQEFPKSELLPEAYLFMGMAYIESDNLDKAEEILLTAEKRFPQLNDNQRITLLLINIAIRREGKAQAIALLEKTRKSIRSEELRIDLLLRTAELYIDLKQYDKAIVLLRKAPRKKKFPLQSFRIDRSLYTCYRAVDSLQLAYDLLVKMLDKKQYYQYHDELLYYQGIILKEMGNTDDAVRIFKKLTSDIDSTTASTDTSSFKARALVELALIYQKQNEDYKKAQSYLTLASKVQDTTSKKFAQNRLSAFERLTKLREETVKGDSAVSHRSFAIGELFRFELDEPDSAYNQFILLSEDSAADTAIIPKALCQAALIAREELGDTAVGDSIFRLMIKRYPASEYAKTAQEALDLKVTVKTRLDSAWMAYTEAEKLFYDKNDVKGAIRAFYAVSKEYAEQPVAPRSLFAAAWFSDNVLHKNLTAKKLYERICEDYDTSIYCTEQAKPRIKIVVDTLAKLDQLRRENQRNGTASGGAPVEQKPETSSTVVDSTAGAITPDESSEPLSDEEMTDTPAAGKTVPATKTDSINPYRGRIPR